MKYRTTFFTRKRLVLVGASVLVAYVGVWAFVLVKIQFDHHQLQQSLRNQRAAFNKLSKEEQAIQKGQTYLVDSITLAKPNERLFLDYLQRKFDLDKTLGVDGPPIDLTEDPATYPLEVHFLARIAYPDKLVMAQPKTPFEGPMLTNVYSANCDRLPLPKNYWPVVENAMKQGGYYMTHVALALTFMKDNGCSVPASQNNLSEKVTDGMLTVINDPSTPQDLRYEAIAFLQMIGHYDQIKSEWIDKIIAEQNADGSWGLGGNDKNTGHTSILAMWSLLEYSHPNTPYEPIIRRPAQQP